MRCRPAFLSDLIIALLVASASLSQAEKEGAHSSRPESGPFRVLPENFNSDKTQQMMRAYQRKKAHAALDSRLEELEAALESPDTFAAYRQKRREYLETVFGPLPERTPLNARITKRVEREGYTIEHVLFESLPGFFVTANLYRPAGDGPFPGILLPCGHSANGKAYSSYQKASILLARHGFVVLCFDPIGQGERRQLIGDEPHPILKPPGEHNHLGVAPILLGRSLAAMMVWDGMRGIDYLCSRPDVDAGRIGCTGNSGGGNLTSYLMAFDDRIAAAAPGCFMTTHRRKNESPGPGDAEQNLYGQIRDGFDHPDFILARAPKPTLVLSATHDYVPIEGAWEAYRQAKRTYTVLGYPERVEMLETNAKHGFSRRMREGATRFFARWLQDRHLEVFEDDEVPTLTDADLQVTPDGQVNWLPTARSLFDLFVESEQGFASARPAVTPGAVRKVTGIRPLAALPDPEVSIIDEGKSPSRLLLKPEPGIALPALYWPGGSKQPIVFAPGDGMHSVIAEARQKHREGHPLLVVEVRDTGETATPNWRFLGADFFIGHMLGRSWVAMRAEDLLVAARWLRSSTEDPSVLLEASGESSVAALHAAFLEPGLISRVTTEGGLRSWKGLMTERDAHQHIHQAVFGALKSYDLPDLQKPIPANARLYRRVPVPEPFLVTESDHTFGGDLRIGDLDGDGSCDFLIYRSVDSGPSGPAVGGHKPAFLGAFTMDGEILWSAGEPSATTHPVRPGPVAIYDLDGDGAAEVINFWHKPTDGNDTGWDSLADVVVQIRDGRTGEVLREVAPSGITTRRCAPKPGEKLSIGRLTANWVHQRILVANFRGTTRPRDFVIKLGDTHVALDENLDLLWTYTSPWTEYSKCPSYIPSVGDIDGDGCDEVNAGYFLLDQDGTPLWESRIGDNMDSVAITEWDEGQVRAICSGFGHVMDERGNAILALGKEEVPHGQEVRVADFRSDLPGPEMALRHKGHTPDLIVVSSVDHAIVGRHLLNPSPTNVGMEPVFWNAPGFPALLYNGGWLWDLESGQGSPLPDLPAPNGGAIHRMGFHHAIPADLCGDSREELVLWDPTATDVFIYTRNGSQQAPYAGYRAGPRQYNPRIMD